MKLKYKASYTWLTMGIIWISISIFLFFKYIPNSGEENFYLRLSTLIILPILISIYYFSMPLINYVKTTKTEIIIHKSLGIFYYKIKIDDLKSSRVLNSNLEFTTLSNKTYSLHLDWVKKTELIDFIEELLKSTPIYDGNTQKLINIKQI